MNNFTKSKIEDPSAMKLNPKKIYKSKIADVPTPGYSGHTSIFIKPISYLNKDVETDIQNEENIDNINTNYMSGSFKNCLQLNKEDEKEVKI